MRGVAPVDERLPRGREVQGLSPNTRTNMTPRKLPLIRAFFYLSGGRFQPASGEVDWQDYAIFLIEIRLLIATYAYVMLQKWDA